MKALTELKKVMRNLWARITASIILRRIQSTPDSPLDFGRLMEQPEDWLIMMPVEANAFDAAMMYCRELLESLKGVRLHLVVPDEFRHWVTTSPSLKVHPFHRQDLFLGRFPRHSFLQRIRRIGPIVAVDLSPCSTPLSLSVCGLCGARVRGALSRVDGDAVFNFLVKTRAGELGDRYRALFAYLS